MAANSIGQSQVAAASNRAAAAEHARQQQLQQEASALQQHSNSLYQGFEGKQAERASSLADAYRAPQTAAGGAPPPVEAPATASNITTQGEANQRSIASVYAGQQADALGALRSFNDVMGTAARGQARDAGQIGQIGNFMRGSSSVLPFELNAASHAGDTMKTLGGLAGGLGKVGVAAGLSGVGSAPDTGLPSLPTFTGFGGSSTIEGIAAAQPKAPLSLASAFGALPSFAGASNPYRSF